MPLMNLDGTEKLGFLIHDAARLMRKRFEILGSSYGLSAAQWRLLVRVVKDEGVAQARLAELLEIEPISVSRLLDRMEESGWVERRQDAADRRVRMIFPTDKSRQAFGAIKGVAGEVFEQAMAGLDHQQRQGLVLGLKTIVHNLAEGEVSCMAEKEKGKAL